MIEAISGNRLSLNTAQVSNKDNVKTLTSLILEDPGSIANFTTHAFAKELNLHSKPTTVKRSRTYQTCK